jgi:type VI secretion system protein ImpJ
MLENAHSPATLSPKVVWSEGMYIGPHHFQLQSRHFEDSIRFVTSSLWFEPYGIVGLQLDSEALQNGTVALVHARGIFPDGLPFNLPETDATPAPRSITHLLAPPQESAIVLLGVPLRKSRGLNCSLESDLSAEAPVARYSGETRVMPDENTGGDDRPVQVAKKNLRLLLDSEPADGFTTLPLGRIRRDETGRFLYDPNFVPPVLQIQTSQRLVLMTRRLVEILDEKGASIERRASAGSEFTPMEIAKVWLLHAINSASAALRHLLTAKERHPEELFVELSRLAGALCTFKLDSQPMTLPAYDHRSLSASFDALDRHIQEHLEITLPTNCISIPLRSAGDCFYEGEISDLRCLGRSRWVLALHAPIGEADLMVKTPRLVKICSPQFVRELVKRALPGLALKHLGVPPPAISSSAEKQYFGISRVGPCWEHMVQTRKVGVYVPTDIPSPELEILVVLEQ